jgi:hypothetical protein
MEDTNLVPVNLALTDQELEHGFIDRSGIDDSSLHHRRSRGMASSIAKPEIGFGVDSPLSEFKFGHQVRAG